MSTWPEKEGSTKRMFQTWFRTIKLATWILIMAGSVGAQTPSLSPDLGRINQNSQLNVIVQFKSAPSDSDFQRILSMHPAIALRMKMRLVKGGAYSVPAAMLTKIAADQGVAYVTPDRPVSGMLDLSAAAINAGAAWSAGWDGSGVGVAVIDSGLLLLPDFQDPTGKSRITLG